MILPTLPTGGFSAEHGVADQGAALGHAVAAGHVEADLAEEVLDVPVQGRAADDQLLVVAAEDLVDLVADLLVHHVASGPAP